MHLCNSERIGDFQMKGINEWKKDFLDKIVKLISSLANAHLFIANILS